MTPPLPERGRIGNIVVSARAALRAQHLVMLIEEKGLHPDNARRRVGVSIRTAKRYRAAWGDKCRDLRKV